MLEFNTNHSLKTPAIMALDNDEALSKAALTMIKNCAWNFEEHGTAERLVILIIPFEKSTTIICTDQSPTMHKVLPIVVKLSQSVRLLLKQMMIPI